MAQISSSSNVSSTDKKTLSQIDVDIKTKEKLVEKLSNKILAESIKKKMLEKQLSLNSKKALAQEKEGVKLNVEIGCEGDKCGELMSQIEVNGKKLG